MPVHEPTRSFDDSIIHKSSIMIQSPAGENLENLKCVQHLHSREPIDDRIYKTRVLYRYSHTLVYDIQFDNNYRYDIFMKQNFYFEL